MKIKRISFIKFYAIKAVSGSVGDVHEPSTLDLFTVADDVFSSWHARFNSLVAIEISFKVTWVPESIHALPLKILHCVLFFGCLPGDTLQVHLYVWFWVEFSTSEKEFNKDPLTVVSHDFFFPTRPVIIPKYGLVLSVFFSWEERVC